MGASDTPVPRVALHPSMPRGPEFLAPVRDPLGRNRRNSSPCGSESQKHQPPRRTRTGPMPETPLPAPCDAARGGVSGADLGSTRPPWRRSPCPWLCQESWCKRSATASARCLLHCPLQTRQRRPDEHAGAPRLVLARVPRPPPPPIAPPRIDAMASGLAYLPTGTRSNRLHGHPRRQGAAGRR